MRSVWCHPYILDLCSCVIINKCVGDTKYGLYMTSACVCVSVCDNDNDNVFYYKWRGQHKLKQKYNRVNTASPIRHYRMNSTS